MVEHIRKVLWGRLDNTLQGSRSELGTLIGVEPGLCDETTPATLVNTQPSAPRVGAAPDATKLPLQPDL
jgi:hypothetical protein